VSSLLTQLQDKDNQQDIFVVDYAMSRNRSTTLVAMQIEEAISSCSPHIRLDERTRHSRQVKWQWIISGCRIGISCSGYEFRFFRQLEGIGLQNGYIAPQTQFWIEEFVG
jgi:hypothetical protein